MPDAPHSPAYALDAFAVLALLFDEPGAATVEELLTRAQAGEVDVHLSVVNLAEVLYRLERELGEAETEIAYARLTRELPISLVDADLDLSVRAARLKAVHPLSLADGYAAALAQRLDATLVTGDPDLHRVEDRIAIEWLPEPQ